MTYSGLSVNRAALDSLRVDLQRIQAVVRELHGDDQSILRLRLGRLEAALADAEADVQRCRSRAAESDDDDSGNCRDATEALWEAQDRLRALERRISEVDDALRAFRRSSQDLSALIQTEIPRALALLDRKIKEVDDYSALSVADFTAQAVGASAVPLAAGAASVSSGGLTSGSSPANATHADAHWLARFALPAGFQWVEIDRIDQADDLREGEGFPKVGREEMFLGLQRLEQVVLPACQRLSAGEVGESLAESDRARNLAYADGSQRVFEAFFGEGAIVLTVDPVSGRYRVTNGRHRIHVARQQGWAALPVRVV